MSLPSSFNITSRSYSTSASRWALSVARSILLALDGTMIIKLADGGNRDHDCNRGRDVVASTLDFTDDLPPYTPSSTAYLNPSTLTSSWGPPFVDGRLPASSSSAMSNGIRRDAKIFILVDEHGEEYDRWSLDPHKNTRVIIEFTTRSNSVSITTKAVPRRRHSERSHATERADNPDVHGDSDGEGEGERVEAERDVRRSGRGRGRGSGRGRGRGVGRRPEEAGERPMAGPLEWFGNRRPTPHSYTGANTTT